MEAYVNFKSRDIIRVQISTSTYEDLFIIIQWCFLTIWHNNYDTAYLTFQVLCPQCYHFVLSVVELTAGDW